LSWKGTIFDWDGVVVDSSAIHLKSWEELAEELDLELPPHHFEHGFGKRNETIIPEILKWTESDELISRWGKRKEEIYREIAKNDGISIGEGAREFFTLIQQNKIRSVVGSSTERANIKLAIQEHKLETFFEGIISSEDVSIGKPNPEVFNKAANLLGLSAHECLVIEDSPHGIEAGQRGGMKTLALTTTHPEEVFLELKPDLVFSSLKTIDPDQVKQLFE
jgi:HAD superfamily hydrolase (TIGR01509 family)